jgi:hypothetical protein
VCCGGLLFRRVGCLARLRGPLSALVPLCDPFCASGFPGVRGRDSSDLSDTSRPPRLSPGVPWVVQNSRVPRPHPRAVAREFSAHARARIERAAHMRACEAGLLATSTTT